MGHRVIFLSVMTALHDASTQQKRIEKLLAAFEVLAGIRSTAQDDLVDDDLSDDAETHLRTVLSGLDAIKPEGRILLAPFLDSYNLDVRACAAVALLELMPDRVIPVLRDLAENAAGTNAGATALEALEKRR